MYPEQTTASSIAQELGHLPLALDQAGAYIHMSQYSLGRYIKEYQTNAGYLLSEEWKGGKQDRSVFATLEISFNAVQEKSPNAAKILLICGFLDNEDICEELLKRRMELETRGMSLFYIDLMLINLEILLFWIWCYVCYVTSLMYCYRSGEINSDIIFILASEAEQR